MRRLIVEVVLNAAIVFVVLVVFSWIHVPQPFPFGVDREPIFARTTTGVLPFLWAGLVLSIVDRFARPVIIALTGRLLLSTMGLFLVGVNTITLWVATFFVPELGIAASPRLLWLLIAAAIYTILSSIADAVFGLNVPIVTDDGRPRSIWRVLDALPTPRRNRLDREHPPSAGLRDALSIRPRHRPGTDAAGPDPGLVPAPDPWSRRASGAPPARGAGPADAPAARTDLREDRPDDREPPARRFRRRSLAELEKLQSEVAPFAWDDARAIIVDEFGKPPGGAFRDDRDRAVRRGLDRAGPSGHAARRPRSSR